MQGFPDFTQQCFLADTEYLLNNSVTSMIFDSGVGTSMIKRKSKTINIGSKIYQSAVKPILGRVSISQIRCIEESNQR